MLVVQQLEKKAFFVGGFDYDAFNFSTVVDVYDDVTGIWATTSLCYPSAFGKSITCDGATIFLVGARVVDPKFGTKQFVMEQLYEQPDPCAELACPNCTVNQKCVWCETTPSCIPVYQRQICPRYTRDPSRCCVSYMDCVSCTKINSPPVPTCIWCGSKTEGSFSCIVEQFFDNCSIVVQDPSSCLKIKQIKP